MLNLAHFSPSQREAIELFGKAIAEKDPGKARRCLELLEKQGDIYAGAYIEVAGTRVLLPDILHPNTAREHFEHIGISF